MNINSAPPIFSRIVLVVSAFVMVGVLYIFVSFALEPAYQVPPTPPKKAEVFNPKADVSQNPAFNELKKDFMEPVPDMPVGRENPFKSIIEPAADTATPTAVPRARLQLSPVATGTEVLTETESE